MNYEYKYSALFSLRYCRRSRGRSYLFLNCDECWKNIKWQEENRYVFLGMEKAFDCVPRKGVMEREVFAITELYKNIKPSIKLMEKDQNNVM